MIIIHQEQSPQRGKGNHRRYMKERMEENWEKKRIGNMEQIRGPNKIVWKNHDKESIDFLKHRGQERSSSKTSRSSLEDHRE